MTLALQKCTLGTALFFRGRKCLSPPGGFEIELLTQEAYLFPRTMERTFTITVEERRLVVG